jgi:hypothetical protein
MIYIIVPFRDLPRQPHMVSAASSLSPSGAMLAGRRLGFIRHRSVCNVGGAHRSRQGLFVSIYPLVFLIENLRNQKTEINNKFFN